jgi:hypothetical protein
MHMQQKTHALLLACTHPAACSPPPPPPAASKSNAQLLELNSKPPPTCRHQHLQQPTSQSSDQGPHPGKGTHTGFGSPHPTAMDPPNVESSHAQPLPRMACATTCCKTGSKHNVSQDHHNQQAHKLVCGCKSACRLPPFTRLMTAAQSPEAAVPACDLCTHVHQLRRQPTPQKQQYQLATCARMRCYVRRRAAQSHTPDTHKCMRVSLRATHHMQAAAMTADNNWKHTPHQLPHACTTSRTQ